MELEYFSEGVAGGIFSEMTNIIILMAIEISNECKERNLILVKSEKKTQKSPIQNHTVLVQRT